MISTSVIIHIKWIKLVYNYFWKRIMSSSYVQGKRSGKQLKGTVFFRIFLPILMKLTCIFHMSPCLDTCRVFPRLPRQENIPQEDNRKPLLSRRMVLSWRHKPRQTSFVKMDLYEKKKKTKNDPLIFIKRLIKGRKIHTCCGVNKVLEVKYVSINISKK